MTGSFPTFHSSFLGRKNELDEAHALLTQTRWLTITGPGGVGKTRFATVLSQRFEPRHFVDASPLESASALLNRVRETLELPPPAAQPDALALPEPLWLVVDNLEHIQGAGEVIAKLCAANPQLHLICTSITPLGSSAEQLYPLPPLRVTPEAPDGAVALFIERARARRPHWQPNAEELQLVSKLCAALDGLPLAVELVAARSHSLPLGAMLARLLERRPLPTDDPSRIARHATLQAVLDWSWNLLSDAERLGLTALAWLETSFTLPFGARLLEPLGLDSGTPVVLVEKALMYQENDRYHLLSTVRSYVRQRTAPPETLWAALTAAVAPLVLETYPQDRAVPSPPRRCSASTRSNRTGRTCESA